MTFMGHLDLTMKVFNNIEFAFESDDFDKAFETIKEHNLFEKEFKDSEIFKDKNGKSYHFFGFSNDNFLMVHLFLNKSDCLFISVKIESKLPPFEAVVYSKLAEKVHTDTKTLKKFVKYCKRFYRQ